MNTFRIAQPRRPVYQFVPTPEQKPLTLRRALYNKFLRWIEQTPIGKILQTLLRVTAGLLLLAGYVAPHPTLRFLLALARWHSYRLPMVCGLLFVTLNLKRSWRFLRRRRLRPKGENGSTFHGLPVGSLASFLIEHNGFKFKDATSKLALPQRKYAHIIEDLDKHGILVRGENNAWTLRPITIEQLVRQLRDNFPLMWDDVRSEWTEKDDAYGRHLRDRAFRQRKLDEEVGKKERKLERIEKKIEQTGRLASLFPAESA